MAPRPLKRALPHRPRRCILQCEHPDDRCLVDDVSWSPILQEQIELAAAEGLPTVRVHNRMLHSQLFVVVSRAFASGTISVEGGEVFALTVLAHFLQVRLLHTTHTASSHRLSAGAATDGDVRARVAVL